MKKLMVAAILAAGAFCMTGCEKKSETEQLKDDAAAMSEKAQKQAGDAAKAASKAAGDAVDGLKKALSNLHLEFKKAASVTETPAAFS